MKKRYQIEQQRAVQQFRKLAAEQNPNIQMILPLADIVGLLQEGVGNLLRQAGLELMHLAMEVVEACCMSMLCGIQPSQLRSTMSAAR